MASSVWPRSSINWVHPNDQCHQFSGNIEMAQVINIVGTSKWPSSCIGGYIQIADVNNLVATSK